MIVTAVAAYRGESRGEGERGGRDTDTDLCLVEADGFEERQQIYRLVLSQLLLQAFFNSHPGWMRLLKIRHRSVTGMRWTVCQSLV